MSIDFPKEEEAIIQRWREIDAFHRQVCLCEANSFLFFAVAHADKMP
jgi:hypothetical protein